MSAKFGKSVSKEGLAWGLSLLGINAGVCGYLISGWPGVGVVIQGVLGLGVGWGTAVVLLHWLPWIRVKYQRGKQWNRFDSGKSD